MSLINDALKRARDAESKRSAAAPQPPLAPVDNPPRPNRLARWALIALVLATLILSAISFWKWAHHQPTPLEAEAGPRPSSEPAAVHSALPWNPTDPIVSPDLTSPVSTDPEPIEEAGLLDLPDALAAAATAMETPPPEAEPVAEPTAEPELRLQSIIYRLRNPAVVINGEMLHVGDSIAGGEVIEIQRHAVTVRRGESNHVMQLPRF
jgi:hypothetical protein